MSVPCSRVSSENLGKSTLPRPSYRICTFMSSILGGRPPSPPASLTVPSRGRSLFAQRSIAFLGVLASGTEAWRLARYRAMPLDWLNTPLDADIGELLARKKRAKAIETLRRQLQGRLAPPVTVRLQLADLLMQAGRAEEAVPVLLGLADEFAADGFVAKAVAILKRVDRAQPGRADVSERLEKLVHQQRRVAELPSRPRAALPVFGIEEFGDAPDLILPAEELEPDLPESAPLELEPEGARDVEIE